MFRFGIVPGWRRLAFVLAFVCVAGVSLAGCSSLFGGSEGGGGSVLNDYAESEITDLNSTTATSSLSFSMLNNINEGLYRLDTEEEPQPAMAEGVEVSEDRLTYTFMLREGIEWSNGEPVTSEDFRYAWLRTMDPETAGSYAFILADYIAGGAEYAAEEGRAEDVAIDTPDERTLEVTLTDPTPFFLDLTAFPAYFPLNEAFVEEQGEDFALSAESLLYNGPYTVSELDPSSQAVLQRNEEYWDAGNVDIDEVNLRVVQDNQTALNLYENGELDVAGLLSEDVERYRDSPELREATSLQTLFMYMNNEDPVLQNENIRRALALAIDKEAFTETILADGSEPAYGVVPPEMAGPGEESFREFAGEAVAPGFDPERARELWEQGVEELGEEPTLEILSADSTASRDRATYFQAQFEENLGANAEVSVLPLEALLERQGEGDYQIGSSTWLADFNDPVNFLDLFTSDSSFNYPNYSNEEYDRLMEQVATEADNDERMRLMQQAEQLLLQEAGLAPVYYVGGASLAKPQVEFIDDFDGHPLAPEVEYKYLRINEDAQQ